LWPEDMELLHQIWLKLTSMGLGHKLHHRDVVRVALRRLEDALVTNKATEVVEEVRREASGEAVREKPVH
jgi:hypothetical protein